MTNVANVRKYVIKALVSKQSLSAISKGFKNEAQH